MQRRDSISALAGRRLPIRDEQHSKNNGVDQNYLDPPRRSHADCRAGRGPANNRVSELG